MPSREQTRRAAARLAAIATAALLAAGCATAAQPASERAQRADARYVEYESFAGAQVSSFQLRGALSGWVPLGDEAVAVSTSPSRTWLLDLSGPCDELRSAIAIGLTSRNGTVSAKFDKVLPRSRNSIQIPCHISRIRPVDEKAMRAARRGEGEGATPAAPVDMPPPAPARAPAASPQPPSGT